MEGPTEFAYRVVDEVADLPPEAMEGSQAFVKNTRQFFVFTAEGWNEFVDPSKLLTREEAMELFVQKGKPSKGGA